MQADKIVALQPVERLRQNSDPIVTIYRSLDTASADLVVTRALAELALTMTGIVAHVRAHDLADLGRQLRRLQRLAENLGMVSLGQVASDMRGCLDQEDRTAFSAVWARLLRVAERSLASDKDLLDQSLH